MIPLKSSYKARYLKRLRDLDTSWRNIGTMSFSIKMPIEQFDWVNALEFGTRQGKGPYFITPKAGKLKLVFVSNGSLHFEGEVLHPGIRPHRFIANSIPDINKLYEDGFVRFVVEGPDALEQYLKSIGEQAKSIIVENLQLVTKSPAEKAEERQFGSQFPDQAGRLRGEAPSENFGRLADVVVERK